MPVYRSFEIGLRFLGLYWLLSQLPALLMLGGAVVQMLLVSAAGTRPGPPLPGIPGAGAIEVLVPISLGITELALGLLLLFAPRLVLWLSPLRGIARANAKINRRRPPASTLTPLQLAQITVVFTAAWQAYWAWGRFYPPSLRWIIEDPEGALFELAQFQGFEAATLLLAAILLFKHRAIARQLIRDGRSGSSNG